MKYFTPGLKNHYLELDESLCTRVSVEMSLADRHLFGAAYPHRGGIQAAFAELFHALCERLRAEGQTVYTPRVTDTRTAELIQGCTRFLADRGTAGGGHAGTTPPIRGDNPSNADDPAGAVKRTAKRKRVSPESTG